MIDAAGGARALCAALGWEPKGIPSELSDVLADRYALKVGLHPSEVWGTAWFDAALTLHDRQMLAGGWRTAWLWEAS